MLFARYEGSSVAGITAGKVYAARSAMGDETLAASGGPMTVVDDDGVVRTIDRITNPCDWRMTGEAYAVVLKPFPLGNHKAGDVVVVKNWTEDGKIGVRGLGVDGVDGSLYVDVKWLAVIDSTNLYPGVVICDVSSGGYWKRVVGTNDELWVMCHGDNAYRSPDGFRWAVSDDGDLMLEPYMVCVASEGVQEGLTKGKGYLPHRTTPDGLWTVRNDEGNLCDYLPLRFRMG